MKLRTWPFVVAAMPSFTQLVLPAARHPLNLSPMLRKKKDQVSAKCYIILVTKLSSLTYKNNNMWTLYSGQRNNHLSSWRNMPGKTSTNCLLKHAYIQQGAVTLAWSGHYKFIWSVQPTFTALCSADNFFTVLTSWWPEWTSEPPIFCPQFNEVLTAHVLICSRVLLSIPPQLFNWKTKTLHFLFGRELTLQVDKLASFNHAQFRLPLWDRTSANSLSIRCWSAGEVSA